jgi:hypothetical protein
MPFVYISHRGFILMFPVGKESRIILILLSCEDQCLLRAELYTFLSLSRAHIHYCLTEVLQVRFLRIMSYILDCYKFWLCSVHISRTWVYVLWILWMIWFPVIRVCMWHLPQGICHGANGWSWSSVWQNITWLEEQTGITC